jgi:hypothetical protein
MHGTMMKLDCTKLADPFGRTVFHRLKPDTYSIRGSSSISSAPFKVSLPGTWVFTPLLCQLSYLAVIFGYYGIMTSVYSPIS